MLLDFNERSIITIYKISQLNSIVRQLFEKQNDECFSLTSIHSSGSPFNLSRSKIVDWSSLIPILFQIIKKLIADIDFRVKSKFYGI